MPKKILLIENDPALLGQLTETLGATGFEVRATGDGKEGLDLARDWAPEAIVLCVELPGMSGYLVCQKLKKDEALKGIPLVLTSAEATEETFEKHKTLKARADEYLLKPYAPPALVEKLGALVGLPEGAPAAEDTGEVEELVSLEEEIGIGAADGEPSAEVAGLDLESLPDEPAAREASGGVDDDLRLLDDAFDGLSTPSAGAEEAAAALDELTGERPMAGEDVDAAAASLPDEDEGAARAALGALDEETDAALGALGADDETLSPGLELGPDEPLASREEPAPVAAAAARPAARGATADLLRAAGIKLLDDEPARAPVLAPPLPDEPAPAGRGGDPAATPRLERELDEARAAAERVRGELSSRDGELRDLRRKLEALGRRADDAERDVADAKAKADASQEKLRKAEADLRAVRDEARRAGDQARDFEAQLADAKKRTADAERRAADQEKRAAELEGRVGELEIRATAAEEDARRKAEEAAAAAESVARADALEREADELRTELLVARGEAEGARGEIEKRTAELKKRVSDLELANSKNEERVVKAYQKIKADEKVRDKVRKAIAIAAQLLEEGLPAESAADKERRIAAGREDRP